MGATNRRTRMFRTIVVGTDGSERAGRAVAQAAELAKIAGAKLHVVHAYRGIESSVAAAMAAGSMVATPDLGDVAQQEADSLNAALEEQAAAIRGDGVDVETHVVAGSPVEVMLDIASSSGADLIVVGNRGMTGAKRLLGSVPNTLAHHAECAVMIVPTGD
jgi:nucleotide-binding universal stress UspA family protein